MIINYLGSTGVTVFTTLVLMTGITPAVPYLFWALAQMKWGLIDRLEVETPRFVRDMIRRRPGRGLFGPLRLILAQHRPWLRGLLGALLPDRRRVCAGRPGLQGAAPHDDRPRRGPALPAARPIGRQDDVVDPAAQRFIAKRAHGDTV
jgi:hypothetical protein